MGAATAMIFVDPESFEGQWLRDSSTVPIRSIEREELGDHLTALTSFREDRPGALAAARMITGVVRSLCAGPFPLSKMDPRISRALDIIRQQHARSVPLEEAARSVFLSPTRFAHLFKDEVGLPFRRYMLWRKLNRAMAEFGRGSNLTDSAHAAGFSDSAHLTHTWHQMFGMSPSIMLGKARFYEIPAPYELVKKHPAP
jgi:AraC family transcriptional regulator